MIQVLSILLMRDNFVNPLLGAIIEKVRWPYCAPSELNLSDIVCPIDLSSTFKNIYAQKATMVMWRIFITYVHTLLFLPVSSTELVIEVPENAKPAQYILREVCSF